MLEFAVADVFTITGLGTVFLGNVESGSVCVGDPVVCRTPTGDIKLRIIAVQDSAGRKIAKGEPGGLVGVVCKTIDLSKFSNSFAGLRLVDPSR
jgi:selenocysteine-specific translation elongation factor